VIYGKTYGTTYIHIYIYIDTAHILLVSVGLAQARPNYILFVQSKVAFVQIKNNNIIHYFHV